MAKIITKWRTVMIKNNLKNDIRNDIKISKSFSDTANNILKTLHSNNPTIIKQGYIEKTGNFLDMAIVGDRYFLVQDPLNKEKLLITKDGSFRKDKNGNLENTSGMKLFSIDRDNEINLVDLVHIHEYFEATKNVKLQVNLNASAEIEKPQEGYFVFENIEEGLFNTQQQPYLYKVEFKEGYYLADISRNLRVFDDKGQGHDLNLEFAKIGVNKWLLTIFDKEDNYKKITEGELIFDSNGVLKSISDSLQKSIRIEWNNGANPSLIKFDLGKIGEKDGLTQLEYPSTVLLVNQDGIPSGKFSDYIFVKDGEILAQYTNGTKNKIYDIALAKIINKDKLIPYSDNVYEVNLDDMEIEIARDSSAYVVNEALETMELSAYTDRKLTLTNKNDLIRKMNNCVESISKESEADFYAYLTHCVQKEISYLDKVGEYLQPKMLKSTKQEYDIDSEILKISNYDMAIMGPGFFLVQDLAHPEKKLLTRVGDFRLTYKGNLENSAGVTLLGFEKNKAEQMLDLDNLVPVSTKNLNLSAKATENIKLHISLNAFEEIGREFATDLEIYDSLSSKHILKLIFKKTAKNLWSTEIYNSKELLVNGEIKFNGDGSLHSVSPELLGPIKISWLNYSFSNLVKIDWGTAGYVAGTPGVKNIGNTDGLRQLDYNYSRVLSLEQDGYPTTVYKDIKIDEGKIIAELNNGISEVIYKVPIVDPTNIYGLTIYSEGVFEYIPELAGELNFADSIIISHALEMDYI